MIFVTGPLFSGKKTYIMNRFGWTEAQLAEYAVLDVQEQAAQCSDLPSLAAQLGRYPVVIATEVGGGIVPIDPVERVQREQAGRLACLLAEEAEEVVRVFCGIPTVLKGAEQ